MSSIESAPIITFTRIPAKVGMDYGVAATRGARAKKGKEMGWIAVGFMRQDCGTIFCPRG
jgi:hypothetical protein